MIHIGFFFSLYRMNRMIFTSDDDKDTHIEQYQFEEEPFNTVAELILCYLEEQRFISQLSGALIQTPIRRDGLPDHHHLRLQGGYQDNHQTSSSSLNGHIAMAPSSSKRSSYFFGETPDGFGSSGDTLTRCRVTRQSQSMMILETSTAVLTDDQSHHPTMPDDIERKRCFESVFSYSGRPDVGRGNTTASLPRPRQKAGALEALAGCYRGSSRTSSDDLVIQEILKKSPSYEGNGAVQDDRNLHTQPVAPSVMPPLVGHNVDGQLERPCENFSFEEEDEEEDTFPQDIDVRTLSNVVVLPSNDNSFSSIHAPGAQLNGDSYANSFSSGCSSPLSLPPPAAVPPPPPMAVANSNSSPR